MVETEIAVVGENIVRLRRKRKLTQSELGQRSGIHFTEISRIEHGMRDLRLSTVMRIASALRVRPGRLLESARSGSTEGCKR